MRDHKINQLKTQLRKAEADLRTAINEQRLVELVEEEQHSLLSIPGLYEEIVEHLNNDALDLADATGVEFESALEQLLIGMNAEEILQIPGVADVLLEEFHDEI